jgi:uncharacterized protein Yka (UPF0111/DUF47 family)
MTWSEDDIPRYSKNEFREFIAEVQRAFDELFLLTRQSIETARQANQVTKEVHDE